MCIIITIIIISPLQQLKKQAKKLAKLRRQIEQSQGEEDDNKQLLEMILTEIANKVPSILHYKPELFYTILRCALG